MSVLRADEIPNEVYRFLKEKNYRLIKEKTFDSLLTNTILHNKPRFGTILNAPPISSKDIVPGTSEYLKLIDQIITDQTTISSDYIKTWEESIIDRYNFFDKIEPELNKILTDAAPTMEKHIDGFYNAGKTSGFNEMKVASFFGDADQHALFILKNYNFDLVKNLSNDLRTSIRQEIWSGTARGDSVQTIAKQILKAPLQPIQAGNRVISAKERSLMIARTESMRAMNQGHLVSYAEYGVEMVEIPPSGTEGDFDQECVDAVDGSPYQLNDPNMPILPLHPNCTHTYSPYGMPNPEGAMDPDTYINLVLGGETDVNPMS